MTTANQMHSFHIPVMGTAFTIDSPIRVAKYGISSVISIIDDELIEKMNAFIVRDLICRIRRFQKTVRIPAPNVSPLI